MTTNGDGRALVKHDGAALQTLAAQINDAHDAALASVRTAVGHACRAGDLLLVAKRQVGHGAWLPWLRQHCTEVSPRTAQKYMQLARELPQLTAKAPRVADLSLREAVHLVSVTGRIAALAPDDQDQVLTRVEGGARPTAAIAAVTRQRMAQRFATPPPHLAPPPQSDLRRRKVNRHEEKRMWQVVMGPNAAGVRLTELLEKTRARPQFAASLAEADAADREAAVLEDRAKDLREDAKSLRADIDAVARDTVINEHGPIHPFSETLTYKICDDALDEHLKTLQVSQVINYLLAHRGEASVQEVRRGYYGDLRFMGWVDIVPPLNGGWTGVGSAERYNQKLWIGSLKKAAYPFA